MKVKRNKNFRRILRFFRLEFGIKEPYKVLVDGTFLTNALQQKLQVREQLQKLLGARFTPMVTGCVLNELRSLGKRGQGAVYIAQSFYRLKCGHTPAIGASDCIMEQIGDKNERKFLVATQDVELAKALRRVPGVPLIRLNNSVPFVEDPSGASREHREVSEKRKLAPAEWERPKLVALQQKEAEAAVAASTPRKRKGPKGPNPLSCKKKKQKKADQGAPSAVEQVASAAAGSGDAGPPPKAKRVRSRRMGTVTRAEAEAKGQGGAAAAPRHVEADADKARPGAARRRPGRAESPESDADAESGAAAASAAAAASRGRKRPRRRRGAAE